MLVMFTTDEKFYALKNGIKDVYVTKTVGGDFSSFLLAYEW